MNKVMKQNSAKPTLIYDVLADLVELTKKLRDDPYAFDRDGMDEFRLDVKEAASKAERILNLYREVM